MNTPHSLEKALSGWTPRRPSPALKRRLFGRPPTPAEKATPAWAWLTPATALFLLLLALQGQHSSGIHQSLISSPPVRPGNSLPEPGSAAYLADAMHSPRNLCQLATFEWTNPVHSLTTAAPFLGTNTLFQ